MRFNDLKGKAGSHRGIEGIATFLQYRHADGGADPMGRGHGPEGAGDLGPGGEGCHGKSTCIRVDDGALVASEA
jgi:hypothetical protein